MDGRTPLDEEDCAKDFCEELRLLMEIHETRGLLRKRMGQSLVGFGVATLNDASKNQGEVVEIVEKTMNIWLNNN